MQALVSPENEVLNEVLFSVLKKTAFRLKNEVLNEVLLGVLRKQPLD